MLQSLKTLPGLSRTNKNKNHFNNIESNTERRGQARNGFSPVVTVCVLLLLQLTIDLAVLSVTAAAVPQCAWVFGVEEGETATNILTRQWERDACSGKHVTLQTHNSVQSGFTIPNAHLPVVQYTPTKTGLTEGSVRYVSQELKVTCDVFTPLCEKATVFYVVGGTESSEPTVTTKAPLPPNDTTTTTTTTTTKAPVEDSPVCPVNAVLPLVTVNMTTPTPLNPLQYVGNCHSPRYFVIMSSKSSTNGAQTNYFSVGDNETLWFDRNSQNKEDGLFSANLTIFCGGKPACSDVQVQVVVPKESTVPPSPDSLPNCSQVYSYLVNFEQRAHLTITPHTEDSCPVGAERFFTLVTPPQYNPDEFHLYPSTGEFDYTGPAGPLVKDDMFVFLIGCNNSVAATNQFLCTGRAHLEITSPLPPPPEEVECPGKYSFTYNVTIEGVGLPVTYNLFLPPTTVGDSLFCADGNYVNVEIRAPPGSGIVSVLNDKTGELQYTPTGVAADYFEFALTCSTGSVCRATAALIPYDATDYSDPNAVYDLGAVVCRGTCDAAAWRTAPALADLFDTTAGPHVTPRRDGASPDTLDVEISASGTALLLRARTTIGNMAARFITFAPLKPTQSGSGKGNDNYFTSATVPMDAGVSFDASCLDRQAKVGLAEDVWTWDDDNGEKELRGHINTVTKAYKSGENYFQKFGGKHRNCDVFRRNPCKYAPMMTPATPNINRQKSSMNDGGSRLNKNENGNDRNQNRGYDTKHNDQVNENDLNSAIDWKLYVNDCDATWVGSISIERLRLLRKSTTNKPIFELFNGTELVGTIYSQVVKPASWGPPYNGILTAYRAYRVRLSIRNSIGTDVEITPISEPTKKSERNTLSMKRSGSQESVFVQASVAMEPTPASSSSLSPLGRFSAKMFNLSVVTRFATGVDSQTKERLYGYSLLLYPYQLNYSNIGYGVPRPVHLNAAELRVTYIQLINSSWKTPNLQECSECTGKEVTCKGTGTGLDLDCDSVIRFEPSGSIPIFQSPSQGRQEQTPYKDDQNKFINVSLIARVIGKGTEKSAGGIPHGSFALRVLIGGTQSVIINVQQVAYIAGVNSLVDGSLCRSSTYWPVADPLGASLPVTPFNATQMLQKILSTPLTGEDTKKKVPYFGPPRALHSGDFCASSENPQHPMRVMLNSTSSSLVRRESKKDSNSVLSNVQLDMCRTPDEEVYGVTDWVYISLSEALEGMTGTSSGRMTLDYLVLSVDASEVCGLLNTNHTTTSRPEEKQNQQLHFLLDGAVVPEDMSNDESTEEEERKKWIGDKTESKSKVYLPWEKYAAFLQYRRIHVRRCSQSNSSIPCTIEPFHFAFVPGALLRSDGSVRVDFYLRAAVRFTPSNSSIKPQVQDLLFTIPVSAQISSAFRFDPDVYLSHEVTESTKERRTFSATALLVTIAIFILALIGAACYIEIHYRGIIRAAKRRLRQQLANGQSDAAVLSHHSYRLSHKQNQSEELQERFHSPLRNNNATNGDSRGKESGLPSDVSGIRTSYGVVQLEQFRMQDAEEGTGGAVAHTATQAMHAEQTRVDEDDNMEVVVVDIK